MASEPTGRTWRAYWMIFPALLVLSGVWVCIGIGREIMGVAPWGPKVGGRLPSGVEVYFQARAAGFETDDRLTVVSSGVPPKHYWVDRVHGGFEHVVLKYNDIGRQVWVESDGKVGASIDLNTGDFRAENDTQHPWAEYGTGTTLDSGNTSSFLTLLRPL